MSKPTAPASNSPMAELSLEALDTVIGGNAHAPIGLGGSLAASLPTIPSAQSSSTSPTGYQDHFGLHFGAGASATGSAAHAATSSTSSSSQSSSSDHSASSDHGSSPPPMGLGGSMPAGSIPNASSSSDHGASGDHGTAGPVTAQAGSSTYGSPYGSDPTTGVDTHAGEHAPNEALGVSGANNAFQLLDEAAQDAIHGASEALGDDR